MTIDAMAAREALEVLRDEEGRVQDIGGETLVELPIPKRSSLDKGTLRALHRSLFKDPSQVGHVGDGYFPAPELAYSVKGSSTSQVTQDLNNAINRVLAMNPEDFKKFLGKVEELKKDYMPGGKFERWASVKPFEGQSTMARVDEVSPPLGPNAGGQQKLG